MKDLFVKAYLNVYKFVAKNRIAKKDLEERHIHSHLVCVFATGGLMWAYAFLAYFTIDHPLPAIVGFSASIVHALSPLLFRVNNNRFLNTDIFLGAGILHQATFGFFCGGFYSNIIIWFGILPVLGGIVCGRRGVVTWLVVSILMSLAFFILQVSNYPFPYKISQEGLLISQALVTFGWIYASAIVVWVFLLLVENHEKEIQRKKEGIQNLICVITHDISNPLMIIIGRTNLLKKADLPVNILSSVSKISAATYNISDIVNNVRNLYATELGKNKIEIQDVELIKLISTLKENFSEKLEAKRISLKVHHDQEHLEIKANADLLLHQILGNLLSNAIKFSSEESEICIKVEKQNGKVLLSVKDSGIGIPDDLILKLFDMNAETSRKGTLGEEGTGFGLPIVKTYVEKLDGKISVASVSIEEDAQNCGTTFTLEFAS